MLWPDIPGLDKFQGKVMHSGDWDTRCALEFHSHRPSLPLTLSY